MKNIVAHIAIFGALLVAGCNPLAYEKQLAGDYYLVAIDSMDQLSVRKRLPTGDYDGIIPARVTGIAVSKNLIVAASKGGIYVLNSSTGEVDGPMSQEKFDHLRARDSELRGVILIAVD